MVEDLGPRLITHHEDQIDYYERQIEKTEKDLARLSIIYSGQLHFESFGTEAPERPPCITHQSGDCTCGAA